MDKDENHEDTKQANCIGRSHTWEILLDYVGTEESFEFYGTESQVTEEMERMFDDTFDGGTTSEGYPPEIPALLAYCEKHDITIELVRNKY